MLKLCNNEDIEPLKNFLDVSDPLAAYILCRIECYGFEKSFCETWLCLGERGITAALSVFCGNAVIYNAGTADFEELGLFLRSGCFNTLLTDLLAAEKLSFTDYEKKQALLYGTEPPEAVCGTASEYKQTYSLLCECFPHEYSNVKEQYLEWLSDLTFRKRRGFARVKSVFEGGELCANVLTVAETSKNAVIGGVCCAKEKRGRGFAGAAVLSAVSELKSENKDVFVLAKDDVANGFYKKLGFEFYKNVAYIERR